MKKQVFKSDMEKEVYDMLVRKEGEANVCSTLIRDMRELYQLYRNANAAIDGARNILDEVAVVYDRIREYIPEDEKSVLSSIDEFMDGYRSTMEAMN